MEKKDFHLSVTGKHMDPDSIGKLSEVNKLHLVHSSVLSALQPLQRWPSLIEFTVS